MALKTQLLNHRPRLRPIALTDTEKEILAMLAEYPGTPLTLEELTDMGGYKLGDTTLGEAVSALNHLLDHGYVHEYELLMPLFNYTREVTLYGYLAHNDYAPLVMFRSFIADGSHNA